MPEPFEGLPAKPAKNANEALTNHHDDAPDYFPTMGPKFGEHQKPPAKGKHAETPDDQQSNHDSDLSAIELLKSAGKAFVHSAFEETGNGAGQLANHLSDSKAVPELELVHPEEEGKLGSQRWFAQTIGSGAGAVIPYLAVDFATRRIGAAAAFLPVRELADKVPYLRTVLGTKNDTHWYSPWAKATLDGGIYGAVLTPASDEDNNFWQQRGINGLTTSIAFGAQFGIAHGSVEALEKVGLGKAHVHDDPKIDVKTLIGHVGSNLLAGTGTGIIGAESYSLLTNGQFADKETVENTVAKFAVASVALESTHLGLSHVLHKGGESHEHPGEHSTAKPTSSEVAEHAKNPVENEAEKKVERD